MTTNVTDEEHGANTVRKSYRNLDMMRSRIWIQTNSVFFEDEMYRTVAVGLKIQTAADGYS